MPGLDDEEEDAKEQLLEMTEYHQYPTRWLMLTLYGLGVCLNNALWVAYTPIASTAAKTYDVSDTAINAYASLYLLTTIIFLPFGSWICDTLGVRWVMILAGILNIIGSWTKFAAGALDDPHAKYWGVFVGQLICSLAQPLYEPVPPKLAAMWFGANERTLATGIGTLAGVSGLSVGYALSVLLVSDDEYHCCSNLNLVLAILVTVPSIGGIFLYREKPPSPPSPSSDTERESFIESVKHVWKQGPFVVILCTVAPGYGVATSLFSLIGDLAVGAGYTENLAGAIGVVLVLSGLVGAMFIGKFLDHSKKYFLLIRVTFGVAALMNLLFVLCLTNSAPAWLVLVVVGCTGFVILALLPVAVELGVEVTYPCAEGVIAGSIKFLGNLFGLIFVFVLEALISASGGSSSTALWFVFFVVVSCAIGAQFVHGDYLRLKYEEAETASAAGRKEEWRKSGLGSIQTD